MQSGISASEELVSQFNTLLADDTHFGLLATIASEALQPLCLLTPSSPGASFGSNVTSLLTPRLTPDEPLFIILRRHTSAPYLIAVTYVPDTAKVRQKMLFASSRLTLVRELGGEHFRETIFATNPSELTAAGFERHDAHTKMEAPLTEEERSLGEVRRAEQEAGAGTGSREIHLSKSFAMPVSSEVEAALKALGDEQGRTLVMLKINPDTEAVELVPDNSQPASISELAKTISSTEPRFTFYRFTHSHDGSESSPVLFFYTCPPAPGTRAIKFRMMYPLMKRAVLTVAETEIGLQIAKKFEIEEPSEITEATVLEELHPKVQTRQAFSRPKRPGR